MLLYRPVGLEELRLLSESSEARDDQSEDTTGLAASARRLVA
jgi:hypothetical protein